jgi:hypothetical protein
MTIALLRVIKKHEMYDMEQQYNKHNAVIFVFTALITFLVLIIWYIGYCPGSFSSDSLDQYVQSITGQYVDWHPVWHTLIFFTLPLKVTGSVYSIVPFQIICFSFCIGYMAMVLYKHAGLKAVVLSLGYIMLNPYTGKILMYPWKDVGFAMMGLAAVAMAAEVYFSKGRWCDKWWHCILLGIVLTNATLFRHNAILFTFFLVIAMFFHVERKQWLKIFFTFVITLVIIKGPLYNILNVESPGQRVVESVGVPLTVIGNVASKTPELMDEELAEFAYAIAPKEAWENNYRTCFNSIKWDVTTNTSVVEEKGLIGVCRLMLKCFRYSPKASFEALFSLTDMVYGIENGIKGEFDNDIKENQYGITYMGNEAIASFLENYNEMISDTIFSYFRHIGVSIVIMVFAMMAWFNVKSWEDWKKIFLCLPIFAYNFGTMLLLTGFDSRFFYISFLVCPLVVMIALVKRRNTSNE